MKSLINEQQSQQLCKKILNWSKISKSQSKSRVSYVKKNMMISGKMMDNQSKIYNNDKYSNIEKVNKFEMDDVFQLRNYMKGINQSGKGSFLPSKQKKKHRLITSANYYYRKKLIFNQSKDQQNKQSLSICQKRDLVSSHHKTQKNNSIGLDNKFIKYIMAENGFINCMKTTEKLNTQPSVSSTFYRKTKYLNIYNHKQKLDHNISNKKSLYRRTQNIKTGFDARINFQDSGLESKDFF